MQLEGGGQRTSECITSHQLVSVRVDSSFDDNLLDVSYWLVVSPSWFVLVDIIFIVVDPDLSISTVNLQAIKFTGCLKVISLSCRES